VATRRKHSQETIADGFPAATVMFADIVGFTQIAGRLDPVQIFALLNLLPGRKRMSDVLVFRQGGDRYIKAVFQYSGGVAAEPGFEIERVRLRRPLPQLLADA